MKKLLSLALCIIMIFSCVAISSGAADTDLVSAFTVTAFEGNGRTNVKLFKRDSSYYLFMPADADMSALVFNFSGEASVNGTKIESGIPTDVFASKGNFVLNFNGSAYNLMVMQSENLPAVYLTTKSGSLDYIHANKENKEPGTITVVEDGKVTLSSDLKQIKGRGNTTWSRSKKPYNIKFDKKTSLFGMDKAKKWSLLANDMDISMIRNNTILGIAQQLPFAFTSEYKNVDLYINGEYKGTYMVCESVEVGSARLDINDLDKANEDANPDVDLDSVAKKNAGGEKKGSKKWAEVPVSPEDITGGYLLEIDYQSNYDQEISGFETNRGQNVVLKSPEIASKSEVDYISDYYQQAEDALASETGYNSLGKHYSEYFDLDTFAMMYVLEEFSLEWDAGQTSCYIYKNAGDDKFYVAPAWDFDMSLGNANIGYKLGTNLSDPNVWFANMLYYFDGAISKDQAYVDSIFTLAYQRHADFRALVKSKWAEFKNICSADYINSITEYGKKMNASAVMNAYRWNKYTTAGTYSEKSARYTADVKDLTDFVNNRINALNKGFASNSAIIYYESNGGVNKLLDPNMYYIGDKATVRGIGQAPYTVSNGVHLFKGWNTKADGSGKTYKKGDKITLEDECTVLYAQWTNANDYGDSSGCSHLCHKDGFQGFIWKIARFWCKLFKTNKTCACGARHY